MQEQTPRRTFTPALAFSMNLSEHASAVAVGRLADLERANRRKRHPTVISDEIPDLPLSLQNSISRVSSLEIISRFFERKKKKGTVRGKFPSSPRCSEVKKGGAGGMAEGVEAENHGVFGKVKFKASHSWIQDGLERRANQIERIKWWPTRTRVWSPSRAGNGATMPGPRANHHPKFRSFCREVSILALFAVSAHVL